MKSQITQKTATFALMLATVALWGINLSPVRADEVIEEEMVEVEVVEETVEEEVVEETTEVEFVEETVEEVVIEETVN